MAGLVTEAIGRDAELKLKKSVAAERSTMLAAIEKLQPNLAALAEEQSAASPAIEMRAQPACGESPVLEVRQQTGGGGAVLRQVRRSARYRRRILRMQRKLASAWHMQETGQEKVGGRASSRRPTSRRDDAPGRGG